MIPDDQIPAFAGLGLLVGGAAYYLAAILLDGISRTIRRHKGRRH
jgi:hypothetical protein